MTMCGEDTLSMLAVMCTHDYSRGCRASTWEAKLAAAASHLYGGWKVETTWWLVCQHACERQRLD